MTTIDQLREFVAWADSPASKPADAVYEAEGFACLDLQVAEVNVRTLFNLLAEIDALTARNETLGRVAEAASEYVQCEGRRYDTTEHQAAAIRAINKLYAALAALQQEEVNRE